MDTTRAVTESPSVLTEQNSHSDALLWLSILTALFIVIVASIVWKHYVNRGNPKKLKTKKLPGVIDTLMGDHRIDPW